MVLGIVLYNEYARLPLSYYIIFISLYIIIKIAGYRDIGNGGKVISIQQVLQYDVAMRLM